MKDIQPVFLLSLQRSGSTLVQRMLASHPQVATVSEPWILVPLLYTLRRRGVNAEYGHRATVSAIDEFMQELPDGRTTYLDELRRMTVRLYRQAAGPGPTHFLDKTPRYALVVDELVETFPDATFIVLWRNPLAVVASIIETWGHGSWNLDEDKVDVYTGLTRLVDGYERNADRMHAIRYEDLLDDPASVTAGMFAHIGIDPRDDAAVEFAGVELRGKMRDPVGVDRYREVSAEPLAKWRSTLDNPFRKAWCRRYLGIIGARRLAVMGYDIDVLLADLEETDGSMQRLGSDLFRAGRGFTRTLFETRLLREQVALLPEGHKIHRHV
jgi:hypothetical protein